MSELIQTIAKFAPLLAKAIIPGADSIISIIENAFGVSGNSNELLNQIKSNPDAAVKLREIEANCSVQLQQIIAARQVEEINAIIQDRANAREMQRDTKSKTPSALAIFSVLGFFGLLSVLCIFNVPISNAGVLDVMIGALGRDVAGVYAFFFGSSSSSEKKDMMIYNSTPVGK